MADSILDSVKVNLGIEVDDPTFDRELITYINGVFTKLTQLGIGPTLEKPVTIGYKIEDKEDDWADFLPPIMLLESVKTFMYLSVRLVFDPPTTSYGITAMKEQIAEIEWRLNVQREEATWTSPLPSTRSWGQY